MKKKENQPVVKNELIGGTTCSVHCSEPSLAYTPNAPLGSVESNALPRISEESSLYDISNKTQFQAQKLNQFCKSHLINDSKDAADNFVLPKSNLALNNKRVSRTQGNGHLSQIIGASVVGIDTIKLFTLITPQNMVRVDNQLKVIKNSYGRKNRLLFVDSAGVEIIGKKAICNMDGVQVTVFPLKTFIGYANSTQDCGACTIQFSVAGICGNGDNSKAVGFANTISAFEQVKQRISKMGIELDFFELKVIRMDLMRNLSLLTSSVDEYLDVFTKIDVSRKQKQSYDTTNLDCNRGESFSIYDKNVERNRTSTTGTLRVEWQMKKSANVKKTFDLQCVTIRDVISEFDELDTYYKQALNRTYFHELNKVKRSPRRFAKGQVRHRLDTLFNALQECGLDGVKASSRLKTVLKQSGWAGVSELVKPIAIEKDKRLRDKLMRCLRELRKSIAQEALEEPSYALKYTDLKNWLML